jgi:hypothetical protein
MKAPTVRLHLAGLEDLEELTEMSFGLNQKITVAKHQERVKRELETHQTLKILLGQVIAGYLVFKLIQDADDGSSVVEPHRLFIKEQFRRQVAIPGSTPTQGYGHKPFRMGFSGLILVELYRGTAKGIAKVAVKLWLNDYLSPPAQIV